MSISSKRKRKADRLTSASLTAPPPIQAQPSFPAGGGKPRPIASKGKIFRIPARPLYLKSRLRVSRLLAIPLSLAIFVTESHWENHVQGAVLFGLGCILVGISTIGRLWCSLYISGYKNRSLIILGPYSLCRNPLYLFSLFGAVGVGLTTETLVVPAIIGLIFALYYPGVIKSEEEKLSALHRDTYEAYVKRVPRFLPRSTKVIEPEEYLVNPRSYRKSMVDALWFIWIVGLLELAEALRSAGILPALLYLY